MSRSRSLACAVAIAVAGAGLVAPRAAAADTLDAMKALPAGVYLLDEPADAWLHERCSYRGLGQYSSTLVGTDGVVATVLSTGGSVGDGIVLKIFRCAETPSFATASFRPGPATVLTCADERPAGQICVPPIVRPVDGERPSASASASAPASASASAPASASASAPASASASAPAASRSATTPRRSLEDSAASVTNWSPPKPRVRGDGAAAAATAPAPATAPSRPAKRSPLPAPRTKIVASGRPPPAPPIPR